MEDYKVKLRLEDARSRLQQNFNQPHLAAAAAFDGLETVLTAILSELREIKAKLPDA